MNFLSLHESNTFLPTKLWPLMQSHNHHLEVKSTADRFLFFSIIASPHKLLSLSHIVGCTEQRDRKNNFSKLCEYAENGREIGKEQKKACDHYQHRSFILLL